MSLALLTVIAFAVLILQGCWTMWRRKARAARWARAPISGTATPFSVRLPRPELLRQMSRPRAVTRALTTTHA